MACSTSLCFSSTIPSPASCSSGSSRFLAIQQVSSAPSLFRYALAPQGKRSSGENVVMVDPLEAKRLAAKQMQEIRAKEKLKKQRQAEAINGALAMIGLTAGLVVEGQTGKGILEQFTYIKRNGWWIKDGVMNLLGLEKVLWEEELRDDGGKHKGLGWVARTSLHANNDGPFFG
ncbi:uncharacterized protein C2845_PM12G20090 [Panicum miliaceum]|uniref:Uncharacterized protein n=1 Tax=Panicum miliaceum TaxID=4540 RepID=A0A3L6QEL8_PANMI|nr:uncharacterized protein C2845_PM12G20090 [Panicum miliaceum]